MILTGCIKKLGNFLLPGNPENRKNPGILRF